MRGFESDAPRGDAGAPTVAKPSLGLFRAKGNLRCASRQTLGPTPAALKLAIRLFCRQRLSSFRVVRNSFLWTVRNRNRRDGAMILSAIGRGEAGKRLKRVAQAIALTAGILPGLTFGLPALAADAADAPHDGVACSIGQPFWVPSRETAETLPWSSVYLGHFSGGHPYLAADGRTTLVDWRDEYVCFPTSAQCRAWVRDSYKTHHRPEGYRACLLLR
jgi:hypothetical protein